MIFNVGPPSGNVTFLFTDIEGSTRIFRRLGEEFVGLLEEHRQLIRAAVAAHGGFEVQTEGDGFFLAFADAASAVAACVDAQIALCAYPWPVEGEIRVRMGLHTGVASPTAEGDYVSLAVHQTARVAAAAHGGQVLMSAQTAALFPGGLPNELSLVDRGQFILAGFDDPERIFQVVHPDLEDSFPVLRAAPAIFNNLPTPLSSFIRPPGDVVAVGNLLEQHRLATLTGVGGVGKTRLAVAAAAELTAGFPAGVWFVDLSSVSDPADVPLVFAAALSIRQSSDVPLVDVVAEFVAGRQLLLVVDNCEHVVDAAAAMIVRLLTASTACKILATSREALQLPGEGVWPVRPLATPVDTGRLEDREETDSVRLFIDRAHGVNPALPLDPASMLAIQGIVSFLDGLPLAIELAAAHSLVLSPAEILARLEESLDLLASRSRASVSRHRTLTSTVDWSYRLLSPVEQAVLDRLSVFRGSFTLDGAQAVAGTEPGRGGEVVDAVWSLAEKSLLSVVDSPGAEPRRYRMLEAIRQFCSQRWAQSDPGEAERTRDAYARYFTDFARRASAELTGRDQGRWLAAVELEHANLIEALRHLLARPSTITDALQMVVHLDRFWHNRSLLSEGAAFIHESLSHAPQGLPASVRCAALHLAGYAAVGRDLKAAHDYFFASYDLARNHGDRFHEARALSGLGLVNYHEGKSEDALVCGQGAVRIARTTGDRILLGECLVAYGLVASDDVDMSRRVFDEALDVTRGTGDRIHTGWSHNNLGNIYLATENFAAARPHLEQATSILAELGAPSPVPLLNLGWVYLGNDNLVAATRTLEESLHVSDRLHLRLEGAYCLLGLACLAGRSGDWDRAVRLVGCADAELEDCGAAWTGPERIYRDRLQSDVERALGSGGEALYDSGRNGDRRGLIDYALRRQGSSASAPRP
jgi:predicted ATPase/class 3 adenylate cyclase